MNIFTLMESWLDDNKQGGTPNSCGYQWYCGWMRPWDIKSYITKANKPEWDKYIPASITPTPIEESNYGL